MRANDPGSCVLRMEDQEGQAFGTELVYQQPRQPGAGLELVDDNAADLQFRVVVLADLVNALEQVVERAT